MRVMILCLRTNGFMNFNVIFEGHSNVVNVYCFWGYYELCMFWFALRVNVESVWEVAVLCVHSIQRFVKHT